jgi:hypothetical protein
MQRQHLGLTALATGQPKTVPARGLENGNPTARLAPRGPTP